MQDPLTADCFCWLNWFSVVDAKEFDAAAVGDNAVVSVHCATGGMAIKDQLTYTGNEWIYMYKQDEKTN